MNEEAILEEQFHHTESLNTVCNIGEYTSLLHYHSNQRSGAMTELPLELNIKIRRFLKSTGHSLGWHGNEIQYC